MFYIDMSTDSPAPKRGDIMQTNVGDKRERTWLILRAVRRRTSRRCYNVWAARWWELEAEMRVRLYESAERNGGQNAIPFFRYPAKKKVKSSQEFFEGRICRDSTSSSARR